jgi:hypothetical protein
MRQHDGASLPGDLALDADPVDRYLAHPASSSWTSGAYGSPGLRLPPLSALTTGGAPRYRTGHQYSGIWGSGWPQAHRSLWQDLNRH